MEKQILSSKYISIFVTIIYALITIVAVLNHELWADEVQVWQICKYLSIKELFNHLHSEGHPAFFYLLIMPFAKLSSNIIYMQLICWLSMCFSVFLLFYKAPFKWFTKCAILLSCGFIYYLPVIARSYSILPFLVFVAAILYSKQRQHPILYALILAAIANTHVIMFGFVFILTLSFIYDNLIKNKNKSCIWASLIMFLGLCTVILQLYDTPESNYYISINLENIISNFYNTFFHFFLNAINDKLIIQNIPLKITDIIAVVVSFGLYLYCFCYLNFNSKKIFFIAVAGIIFQFIVYTISYGGGEFIFVIRIFSAHIILLFCLWICPEQNKSYVYTKKNLNIILSLFFILTIFNGLISYKTDLFQNFSGSKETSIFIQKNINPQNSLIYTDNEGYCVALAYYLDKLNYQMGGG